MSSKVDDALGKAHGWRKVWVATVTQPYDFASNTILLGGKR